MQRLIEYAASLTDVQNDLGVSVDANSMSYANIVDAISVVQKEMGIMGATANEAESTLSGSFASMKAAFSDFLGNLSLGRDIGPSLQALMETVSTYLRNLIPAVMNIVKTLPGAIWTVLSQPVPQIVSALMDFLPKFQEGVTNGLPQLAQSAMQVVSSFVTGISTRLPNILSTGVQVLNSLVSGIMSTIPTLVSSGLSALTEFLNMLIANLPSVLESGKEILLNVVSGIQSALPQIVSAAGNAIASLLSGIVSHLPEILAAGIDLVVSLVAGIGNAIPDIIAAAFDLVKNLWDTIKNTDWLQLGIDIIQGLINGIVSMAGALWDAAVNVVTSAFDGIKNFFGIHSPSRKMRDEVGKFIPAGIAVGIEANTKPLTDAMHSLSDDTVNAFTVPAVGSRTAPRVQVPTNSITLNVYGAEGQDVEDLAEIVMQKLQFLLSRREAQLA